MAIKLFSSMLEHFSDQSVAFTDDLVLTKLKWTVRFKKKYKETTD